MRFTRVDHEQLRAAVRTAIAHVNAASAALEPYFVVLSSDERASMLRARQTFPAVARAVAPAAADHPELASLARFDPPAVVEDLDNAAELVPFLDAVEELHRRASDSRLTWLAEAFVPSLSLYKLAKAHTKVQGALRTIVEPLEALFSRRGPRSSTPACAPDSSQDPLDVRPSPSLRKPPA